VTTDHPPARVLVSDFDGTIARDDFYQVFVRRIAPPSVDRVWADYMARRISHFDTLRTIFGSVAPGEASLLRLLDEMDFDPNFAASVSRLRTGGWDLVVVSAGCRWYIDRLLAGVSVERRANPGRVVDGRLVMEWPADDPYQSPNTGIDKAAVVRSKQHAGALIAFAGDGHPDLEAALLVPPELRFARGVLAEDLRRCGEGFRPFDRWSEIVDVLIG
jgi:2-hydroxy-3-keto-5-methylthiopentenyl-1-phosphate phosphatase